VRLPTDSRGIDKADEGIDDGNEDPAPAKQARFEEMKGRGMNCEVGA
jgi:hypothetical protein